MPHVHWEGAVVEEDMLHLRREGVGGSEGAELLFHRFALSGSWRLAPLELHDEDGDLLGALADADPSAAPHRRVLVEDLLEGNRAEELAPALDAVALAPTHPEAALSVEVAEIAHPVQQPLPVP